MNGFVRGLLWITGIFGAICLLLYLFLFDVWTVPRGPDDLFAASIRPTLMVEDHILVHRGHVPGFGELARCASPTTTGAYVVGRVFGRHGDQVEVNDRGVVTNGKALDSRAACTDVTLPHPATQNLITLHCGIAETGAWNFEFLIPKGGDGVSVGTSTAVVEPGKLYLVSDNRLMHDDSRDFGLVDESTCEHIVFRLWGEKYTDSSRRFTILW